VADGEVCSNQSRREKSGDLQVCEACYSPIHHILRTNRQQLRPQSFILHTNPVHHTSLMIAQAGGPRESLPFHVHADSCGERDAFFRK